MRDPSRDILQAKTRKTRGWRDSKIERDKEREAERERGRGRRGGEREREREREKRGRSRNESARVCHHEPSRRPCLVTSPVRLDGITSLYIPLPAPFTD